MNSLPTLALILSACTAGEVPEKCREFKIPVDIQSPMGCMMASPPLIAKWEGEHPKWKVRRWTCKPEGVEQDT
jgi:hypothetical protein